MSNHFNTIRRLTVFLVISGSLNIFLTVLFFYWTILERPPTPYFESRPASSHERQPPIAIENSESEVIRYFRRMPMEWLIGRLRNHQLVENGYTQRDLALASLVAFHHFDLERALAGMTPPKQQRRIRYGTFRDGTPAEIIVYPGLTDTCYEAIAAFATTERWPLTEKGLFMAMQKEEKQACEPFLVEAFEMTSAFACVERLFSRHVIPVERDELLGVILEGEWSLLDKFIIQQKIAQDLSPARRQGFLLDYIQSGSKSAAKLILKTDGDVAIRKLDDKQVIAILKLLEEKSPAGEQFALALLTSPRSDEVWKMAASRLYSYAGEKAPEKDTREAALMRFVSQGGEAINKGAVKPVVLPPSTAKRESPSSVAVSSKQPISAIPRAVSKPIPQRTLSVATKPPPRTQFYIVQSGDSLWKISRRFNVDVEVIKAYNQLENDLLSPGSTLKIPKKSTNPKF